MKSKKEKFDLEKILQKYNYFVPKELIAQKPAQPRDSAKLLIYNRKTKEIKFDTFYNLEKYLPEKSLLIFNNTKVLPAYLTLKKETQGKVNVLYIRTTWDNLIEVMADRKIKINSKLILSKKISFTAKKQNGKYYYLKPSFDIKNLFKVLEKYGRAPLPPYIKNSPLSEKQKKEQYQTVFAKIKGSVAAPTASLHFTKRLLKKLKKSQIKTAFITLHVGLGTFAPLTKENLQSKKLHEEFFSINKKTADLINKAKSKGFLVIAVGTTVVRALESAALVKNKSPKIKKQSKKTSLFIQEGYKFKIVDGIITNFHVPKSSLIMLVSAFVGRKKLLELYNLAIKNKFRFFSFGDGMLIL
jgi:S-adenosylmethionine:tRNA ribosyltransferase-isomerase